MRLRFFDCSAIVRGFVAEADLRISCREDTTIDHAPQPHKLTLLQTDPNRSFAKSHGALALGIMSGYEIAFY